MKKYLIITLLFAPCIAVLNESNTIIPNILGIIYIIIIYNVLCDKHTFKKTKEWLKKFLLD